MSTSLQVKDLNSQCRYGRPPGFIALVIHLVFDQFSTKLTSCNMISTSAADLAMFSSNSLLKTSFLARVYKEVLVSEDRSLLGVRDIVLLESCTMMEGEDER